MESLHTQVQTTYNFIQLIRLHVQLGKGGRLRKTRRGSVFFKNGLRCLHNKLAFICAGVAGSTSHGTLEPGFLHSNEAFLVRDDW